MPPKTKKNKSTFRRNLGSNIWILPRFEIVLLAFSKRDASFVSNMGNIKTEFSGIFFCGSAYGFVAQKRMKDCVLL